MGDARSQNTQLMRAVRAIATATAGSTPSVTGSTVYNNATTGQYEVITSVLDNTVAGGWTVKTDQTTLPSSGVSANSFCDTLLMYRDTGKSALPYLWFSMIEGAYTSTALHNGPFLSFGYASSLANCNYGAGHNVVSIASATSTGSHVNRFSGCVPTPFSTMTYRYDYKRPAGIYNTATRVFYISATSEYIHIQQDIMTQNATNSGAWFHLGLRTNSSWEDNYNDNPYWVAIWMANGVESATYGTSAETSGYWTVMRPLDPVTGTVGSALNVFRATNLPSSTGTVINPVSGSASSTSYLPQFYRYEPINSTGSYANYPTNYNTSYSSGSTTYTENTGWIGTADPASLHATIISGPFADGSSSMIMYGGLTSDSSTNAIIPEAQPMYTRLYRNTNSGGYLKNMFKSLSLQNNADVDLYHVIDAPYTIDGSTYVGLRTGTVYNNSIVYRTQLVYVKAS